jgi:hypothetical protein
MDLANTYIHSHHHGKNTRDSGKMIRRAAKGLWYGRMESNMEASSLMDNLKDKEKRISLMETHMKDPTLRGKQADMGLLHGVMETVTQGSFAMVSLRATDAAVTQVATNTEACGTKTRWVAMGYSIMQMETDIKGNLRMITIMDMGLITSIVGIFKMLNA